MMSAFATNITMAIAFVSTCGMMVMPNQIFQPYLTPCFFVRWVPVPIEKELLIVRYVGNDYMV
jgi:hypothetical protein